VIANNKGEKNMSLNRITLIGNVGHDPELRYTPKSRQAVVNLSVATNPTYNHRNGEQQERTDWHTVAVYGRLAELCQQYLRKGRQIYVEGSLRTREYEPTESGKSRRVEIVAHQVQFLGTKSEAPLSGVAEEPQPGDMPS
jgi:single-strand DNA-binding protein